VANIKLIIFAKYPEPGQVMTRLCPPLTHEVAAQIQTACIRLLCERAFRSWPVRPVLCVSPDDREDDFRKLAGPFVQIATQGEGDLGERILRMAETTLQEGEDRLLIIGSDSPTISAEHVAAATKKLSRADVVLGPCEDGGFYVLGLKRTDPKMFSGVAWGSDSACEQVKSACKACGLKVATSTSWYDIDRVSDLERAVVDIREANQRDDYQLLRTIETALEGVKGRKAGART
jgi:uncharacterized protein